MTMKKMDGCRETKRDADGNLDAFPELGGKLSPVIGQMSDLRPTNRAASHMHVQAGVQEHGPTSLKLCSSDLVR